VNGLPSDPEMGVSRRTLTSPRRLLNCVPAKTKKGHPVALSMWHSIGKLFAFPCAFVEIAELNERCE
jgi:hypothetical protein